MKILIIRHKKQSENLENEWHVTALQMYANVKGNKATYIFSSYLYVRSNCELFVGI